MAIFQCMFLPPQYWVYIQAQQCAEGMMSSSSPDTNTSRQFMGSAMQCNAV